MLAAGHSLDEVCQTLSVGRSTLYRWRQTPDFAAYLHQLLRTHADESLCQSAQLLSLATAKVKALLEDPKTPPALQMRIAFKILGLYSRPSYLMMLQSLPDTADDVIRAAFRRTQGKEEREMTTQDAKALADHYRNTLKAAQSFDALFPDPLKALVRSKMTQNGTCGAGSVTPPQQAPASANGAARTKMTQSETSAALNKAIDGVLAGIKKEIASAA